MTSHKQVNDQLKSIKEATRHWNGGTSCKIQKLSLMTFLWPLLPNLPPEPPSAAVGLLQKEVLDQCDLCGSSGTPLVQRKVPNTQDLVRFDPVAGSPLSKMMAEIERKMDDTLTSLETTIQKTDKLNKDAQQLELAGQSVMTDKELVSTLQTLTKEKSNYEDRVKVLEVKEQLLKDSLSTAIDWAKKVDVPKELV